MAPDISIIVPVYKTPAAFFTRCIQSLCAQTHKNIEIIIVVDGFSGSEPELCDNLALSDKRIRAIHQENAGVSAARNTGIAAAKGRWCIFVDSDDWAEPSMCADALEAAVNSPDTCPSPDIVCWAYCKEYGKKTEHISFFKTNFSTKTSTDCAHLHFLVLHLTSGLGQVWAKMYRRDFLCVNSFLFNAELSLGEDIDFNLRVFAKISKLIYIEKFNYHYRYDEGTVSNTFNPHFPDKLENFALSIEQNIKSYKPEMQDLFIRALYTRIIHSILTIALRYSFSPANHDSFRKKISLFYTICQRKIFAQSIQGADYTDFHLPRKIALFCLKHRFFLGIWFIAKIRFFQYAIKQKYR